MRVFVVLPFSFFDVQDFCLLARGTLFTLAFLFGGRFGEDFRRGSGILLRRGGDFVYPFIFFHKTPSIPFVNRLYTINNTANEKSRQEKLLFFCFPHVFSEKSVIMGEWRHAGRRAPGVLPPGQQKRRAHREQNP
ncbi:MAG: hypothetical protein IKO52_02140 [Clostridia bacterium]|nr:hypothetical protein [Clostridia bacterium]